MVKKTIEHILNEFNQHLRLEDFYLFVEQNTEIDQYGELIKELILSLDEEEEKIKQIAKELSNIFIKENIPFVILHTTLEYLREEALSYLLQHGDIDAISKIEQGFKYAENAISWYFFEHNLKQIVSINIERRQKIHKIFDPIFLEKYEQHIDWFVELANVFLKKRAFPELDPNRCFFGKWLKSEAKEYIKEEDQYNKIVTIHRNLHFIANKIAKIAQKKKISYTLLYYLFYKAEMFSMSLGFEIALLSNILYIEQARKDDLTGALNRKQMMKILHNQLELACAIEKSFSIVMADLDNFKEINDTYGHLAGDFVLKEWVRLASQSLRKSDFIIRYGGEEFLIVLPATTYNEAYVIAEKLRCITQEHIFKFEGKKMQITASFGVHEVFCPKDETNLSQWIFDAINQADENLYSAKRLGRNRVV